MTERRVRAADEDEPTARLVHMHVTPISENTDPFAQEVEKIRELDGASPTLRRRATRQLSKRRTGEGGAESKQIEPEALYTGYQLFDVVLPPYNLEYLAKLYEMSAPHYAAVNAKVSNIVGLGYSLVETPKTKRLFEQHAGNEAKSTKARRRLEKHRDEILEKIEEFNDEDTFTEVMVKVWRDYEVTGNGYIEIGRKADGTIGYIGHIPSHTMRIRKKRDGFVQISGHKLRFFANFEDEESISNPVSGETPNEVIHIKKYSPTSTFYGVPDIIAAKQAVAGNEFAARFNLDYFENKAVPRHVIILKGATLGSGQEQALLEFFETGLKGQNHRSLFITLPPDTNEIKSDLIIKPVESGVQDSSFNNYRKANIADIMMSHRVPISKVGLAEGVSLAVARDADKTFKEQVCAPEQRVFEKKLNRIIRELTDTLEIKLNEMTLTDADTQSKIDERMVKAGIWLPNEPRVRDGKPTIPGGDTRVDLNAKSSQLRAEETTVRQRDSRRSAGATDSAGEGRATQGEGRTVD